MVPSFIPIAASEQRLGYTAMAASQGHRELAGEQQVELFRRQYLQLMNPDQLSMPSITTLRSADIQAQIYQSMFSKDIMKHPPSKRYQYRVLKRLVDLLERSIQDPDEDVGLSYRTYCILCTSCCQPFQVLCSPCACFR